jgi:hypothetical protein
MLGVVGCYNRKYGFWSSEPQILPLLLNLYGKGTVFM